jgi:hypothetical protein
MPTSLNLKDKNTIADLHVQFKDVAEKYPLVMQFLEYYCGFMTPLCSCDPYEISYSGGKRDVILTIKTLMRDDILPEQVSQFYERNL